MDFLTPETPDFKQLRSDEMAAWIKTEWLPRYPGLRLKTIWTTYNCVNDVVLTKIDKTESFGGYLFTGYAEIESSAVSSIEWLNDKGEVNEQSGAFCLNFKPEFGGDRVDVLVMSTLYEDDACYRIAVAAVPTEFRKTWNLFANHCNYLAYAYDPDDRVIIVGGRHNSFVPTIAWEEVILPAALKTDIIEDVNSFFTKGVEVYSKLNLKPFRKLLLAGVPGTGKTMLCNALAKWALNQGYLVVYISSAQKERGERSGATFAKIQYALDIAASSAYPTLILLEELDAYLHDEEKALILNVLDGSESTINPHGTLLIATTNYPEAIDERVLKRPGRLDRIFIIPETKNAFDAGGMLRRYLGSMWQTEHETLVPDLVGYPGAFIREVAIYALTQVAYEDLTEISLELLTESFEYLKTQIQTRDEFLKQRQAVAVAEEDDE